jgi:hypothetical protein
MNEQTKVNFFKELIIRLKNGLIILYQNGKLF